MPSRAANDNQKDRKRKNADAQAQFRQRRANYISSLEETVTKLEAVVVELQDCLRDAKQETVRVNDERQQLFSLFQHLRQELALREQTWKEAWLKHLPERPLPVSTPSPLAESQSPLLSPALSSCLDPNLPPNIQANSNSPQPIVSPHCAPRDFMSLSHAPQDKLGSPSKLERFDGTGKLTLGSASLWTNLERAQVPPSLLTKSSADIFPCGPTSTTSDNPDIRLPSKRKASPDSSQSRHVSSSPSANSPPPTTHYLHSGADNRVPSQSTTRGRTGPFSLPNLSELSAGFSREDSVGVSAAFGIPHVQSNGHAFNDCLPSDIPPRTLTPPISNTLAVIKATAFGALRRNRAQKRRGDSHATKVALEALEARGLGLGLQPTMTLSSVHSLTSPIDEEKRPLMSMDTLMDQDDHSI